MIDGSGIVGERLFDFAVKSNDAGYVGFQAPLSSEAEKIYRCADRKQRYCAPSYRAVVGGMV